MQTEAHALIGEGGSLVGNRYRIEGCVAEGGFGVVYRAYDTHVDCDVALKRLLSKGGRAGVREPMFEREYRTLKGLKHPRIIEVYDYGVDADGPYYTMELLDGTDLRDLAPLPYVAACRHLRDVASSLALLHARKLVHRDVSPRNVRVTSDGRAKLLDFGALASFGRYTSAVGTPPCTPPEVLQAGMLDQRADLFSLGALAYWVLTGRDAFQVRKLSELHVAWASEPLSPSKVLAARGSDLPSIPPALDALVLSLLSRNPLARPASAAEVISRLSAIAQLPHDAEPLSAQSYLRGSKTVGRTSARKRLRRRLGNAVKGKGAAFLLRAEAGMGAARILEDLAIEARLLSAPAIVIDASQCRGAYGVVEEISRRLHEELPELTRETARPYRKDLVRFLPASTADSTGMINLLSEATLLLPTDPREQRMRTQEALKAWLDDLTERVPLLIAVRHLEQADDASVSLMAALAESARSRGLLLVAAYDATSQLPPQGPLNVLSRRSKLIQLKGLRREEVLELVRETFGEVANTERLADWLHDRTGGNPRACVELIHHLVDSGGVRFVDGVWTLPQELNPEQLPEDLSQAWANRLSKLSDEASALVKVLSLLRGAAPRERCLVLAEREGIASADAVLYELEWSDVLVGDEGKGTYHFRHGGLRDAVQTLLSPQDRLRMHSLLGELLIEENNPVVAERLEAGWHLLKGGEQARGAEILAQVGLATAFCGDETAAAIPALEAALEVMRAQGRSPREVGALQATLAIAGFYADRKVLERNGPEAIRLLQGVIGLHLAGRLRPFLGSHLSLYLAIGTATLRLIPRHGFRAPRELTRLIALFSTTVTLMVGLGVLVLDANLAQRYVPCLKPLCVLGERTAANLSYKLAQAISKIPEDRVAQVLRELDVVLAAMEDPRPIRFAPPDTRKIMHTGALYAKGALEAFRDSPAALEIADRLETMGWRICSLFADQVRTNYYGVRGEVARAQHYREQVELCAIKAGSGWQAEVWSGPARMLAYRVSGDVVGLKKLCFELDQLAEEIPSMARQAQLSRAAYYMERGDLARSNEYGMPVLRTTKPRGFTGYALAVAGEVRAGPEANSAEESLQLGHWALSLYDADDRQVCAMFSQLPIEVALLEAKLGRFDEAQARIEDYLHELGTRGGPTTLGGLHLARARIGLLRRDLSAARTHLELADASYRPTENPALIASVEALRREIAGADLEQNGHRSGSASHGASSVMQVRRALAGCKTHQERLDAMLAMAVEESGGAGGYLFRWSRRELVLVASDRRQKPPHRMVTRLRNEIEHFHTTVTEPGSTSRSASTGISRTVGVAAGERYRPFLLTLSSGGTHEVVGAVTIVIGAQPLALPRPTFLSGIAEALEITCNDTTADVVD